MLSFTLLNSFKERGQEVEKVGPLPGEEALLCQAISSSHRAVVSVWVLQDSLYCALIRPTVFVSLNYLCCFDRVSLDP